jgi:hypothetical protein
MVQIEMPYRGYLDESIVGSWFDWEETVLVASIEQYFDGVETKGQLFYVKPNSRSCLPLNLHASILSLHQYPARWAGINKKK